MLNCNLSEEAIAVKKKGKEKLIAFLWNLRCKNVCRIWRKKRVAFVETLANGMQVLITQLAQFGLFVAYSFDDD